MPVYRIDKRGARGTMGCGHVWEYKLAVEGTGGGLEGRGQAQHSQRQVTWLVGISHHTGAQGIPQGGGCKGLGVQNQLNLHPNESPSQAQGRPGADHSWPF